MPVITQRSELPKAAPVQPTEAPKPSLKQTDMNVGTTQVEEAKADEAISPHFAALARKEKAIRSQAQAIKAREDALKAKEAEYESNYIPKSKLSERFKADPLGLLNENGVDWDQLTQAILNQPGPQDQALLKIQKEMQTIKEAQAQAQTKIEESQKQAYENAVKQIRNEAKQLIDSDEAYETIKETGSSEAVVELIKEQFEKDGTLLSVEDAAKEIENYLIEEAYKLAQLKKVKQKFAPEMGAEKPIVNPEKPMIRTLTNAQVSPSKPASKRERRDRAILAFQGKL